MDRVPRPRPKRGRRRGVSRAGNVGHIGHGRKLVPVEQVQQVIDLKPTRCDECGALLLGEDAQPVRHQVTELPRVAAGSDRVPPAHVDVFGVWGPDRRPSFRPRCPRAVLVHECKRRWGT